MAPGSLREPGAAANEDPLYLLKLRARHGPILKARLSGKITTCIFGIVEGRKFLAENDAKIESATTDFTPLFANGFLRQMNGPVHQEYRRIFMEALKATDIRPHSRRLRQICDELLESLVSEPQPVGLGPIQSASKLALTEILFLLVLGIDRSWANYDAMRAAYQRYAPNGTFTVVKQDHQRIYAEMKQMLLTRLEDARQGANAPNLMATLVAADRLDDTVIGNLLQMTEAGRFDMMGLWAWLFRMIGAHKGLLDKIAAEPDAEKRSALSKAAAMEALRLEQAEFVMRRVKADIIYKGYFIPKRSIVRIAVWEAHKDAASFEDPFSFRPERFLDAGKVSDIYSPFGLGKHRCLGADWVVDLSALLIEQAALGYRWSIIKDAAPGRGRFHFEPSPDFLVEFRRWPGAKSEGKDA